MYEAARALVELADWSIVFSRNGTGVKGYEQAHALLVEAGAPEAAIEELFPTDVPVFLPAFAPNPLGDDISTAGVEFTRILAEIQKASDALNAGPMSEALISLARFQLLFRPVDDDILLVLAISHDGNPGKARYLVRRHLVSLRSEL